MDACPHCARPYPPLTELRHLQSLDPPLMEECIGCGSWYAPGGDGGRFCGRSACQAKRRQQDRARTVPCVECGEAVHPRGPEPAGGRRCKACRGHRPTVPCVECGEVVHPRGPEPAGGRRCGACRSRRPTVPCVECGEAVHPRGPEPAGGRRCKACQPASGPLETRPCFRCGRALAPRRARVTDSPHGRWCSDPKCQKDRAERLGLLEELIPLYENPDADPLRLAQLIAQTVTLFWRMRRGFPPVPCQECGRPDGVRNYRHPTPDWSGVCRALGSFPVPPRDLELAHEGTWPSSA